MPNRNAIFDILDEFDTTGNYEEAYQQIQREYRIYMPSRPSRTTRGSRPTRRRRPQKPKKKRTLSKWQKFMKSPKSQIKYKSGKDKGKLNLRAMGRAYRKKQKGKK